MLPQPRADVVFGPAAWDWRCWQAIRAAILRERPEIVHIQYQTGAYGMHPAINVLPRWLRGLPQRPRLVVTAHDLYVPYLFPKAGPLRTWFTRRLLEDCDARIVTNSDDLAALGPNPPQSAQDAHRPRFVGQLAQPAFIIPIGSNIAAQPPSGYDRGAWRAELGVTPETQLIGHFGLISATKGLDRLVDVLATLPSHYRLLVIGGSAPARQDREYADALLARVAEPGLCERVIVTGHCQDEIVSAHLLACDLIALPFLDGASFRRGSLLAALVHGLPVVTTTPEYRSTHDAAQGLPAFIDRANVLLVPPNDTGALRAAIEALGNDPELRERVGTTGRQLAALFGWEMIAARHRECYQDLLRPA
jgi:glycosyltransferase involved in cell wall biosynthesis